jgi:hypothetical protein
MRTALLLTSVLALAVGAPAISRPDPQQGRCAVTAPTLPSGRYGTSRLRVALPRGGVVRALRNVPDDGQYGTKLGWVPDRDRSGVRLAVAGRRLDAPGRMRVLGVYWGRGSDGVGSWASAVSFPAGGCWRISGRAGTTTLSFVVRVVTRD